MANKIPMDRRLLLLSASAFVLAGCGGLGLGPTDADQTIYVLQPALTPPPAGGAPATWALAVDVPGASDSIDSRRIALIKSDATMDYYANSSWPDRLPVLVQTALVAAFQASGRVPSVSRTQDALHADYELGVEIRDCAAHYGAADDKGKPSGNPSVAVTLIAQMSTAHGRLIVANFTATQKADASQNSTGAVVQALNTALGAAVEQIVAWALTLPAPGPSLP
jgi:cholesterol transport system auxiliary component